MNDLFIQIILAILSVSAIILVARKNKWGFVFGLCSQPFWFITSYTNQQWGVFFISIIYTFSWAYGVYEWFYKDKAAPDKPDARQPLRGMSGQASRGGRVNKG